MDSYEGKIKRNKMLKWANMIVALMIVCTVGYFYLDSKSKDDLSAPNIITSPNEELKYICGVDTYDCRDFKTFAKAQEVFLFCGGSDNDVHQLDDNGDGVVCENLQ